jgi:hypothetical protein
LLARGASSSEADGLSGIVETDSASVSMLNRRRDTLDSWLGSLLRPILPSFSMATKLVRTFDSGRTGDSVPLLPVPEPVEKKQVLISKGLKGEEDGREGHGRYERMTRRASVGANPGQVQLEQAFQRLSELKSCISQQLLKCIPPARKYALILEIMSREYRSYLGRE